MPEISVIMPVYNADKYLIEAIDSILNQTFEDIELICINNGSTDNSEDILLNYAKKDKRVMIRNCEKGIVNALNKGIEVSSGKYIARMDADDIAYSYRLEKQYNFLEKNKDISVIGAYIELFGNDTLVDQYEDTNEKYRALNVQIKEKGLKGQEIVMLDYCALVHPTTMFSADFINKMDGYKHTICEDYDLWLRATKQGYNFWNLEEILLKYRRHGNCLTIVNGDEMDFSTMEYKFNYCSDIMDKIKTFAIWGASNRGLRTLKFLEDRIPQATCTFFIDSFKEGSVENKIVIKPEQVDFNNCNYVLIATTPGRSFATEFLKQKGLNSVENFLYF